MVTLGETLTALNVLIASGVIASAIVSWFRGGFIMDVLTSLEKIDHIENQVDDIHKWKDGAEDVLVAISKAEDEVDAAQAKDRLGMNTDYRELLDDEYSDLETNPDGSGESD